MPQILTSTATRTPLVFHQGILLDDGNVCHNTPIYGKPVCEAKEDFTGAGRKILKSQPLPLTDEEILQRHAQLEHQPFHLLTFNCEQYVSEIATGRKVSHQLIAWLMAASVITIYILSR